jgi:hypothetical protein
VGGIRQAPGDAGSSGGRRARERLRHPSHPRVGAEPCAALSGENRWFRGGPLGHVLARCFGSWPFLFPHSPHSRLRLRTCVLASPRLGIVPLPDRSYTARKGSSVNGHGNARPACGGLPSDPDIRTGGLRSQPGPRAVHQRPNFRSLWSPPIPHWPVGLSRKSLPSFRSESSTRPGRSQRGGKHVPSGLPPH